MNEDKNVNETEVEYDGDAILNLTRFKANQAWIDAGVVDVDNQFRKSLGRWTLFHHLPSPYEIKTTVSAIVRSLDDLNLVTRFVLISGYAQFLLPPLVEELRQAGKVPLVPHTRKAWNNKLQAHEIKHMGFVEIP